MKAYKFRHLVVEFNALLDTRKYDGFTVGTAKAAIREGRVGELLNGFGKDIDVSIFEPDDWKELNEEWHRFADAIDERRKLGVANRGLCLFLAYALQSYIERTDPRIGQPK